ncbi:MAG: hypothetical protein HN413_07995 [Chloroflexi bacterium]|jgi:hypothetical protein|nr:hypothetical protein [Chloroflexota bacterium]
MRYGVYDHQKKAAAYIDALEQEHRGTVVTQCQHIIPEVGFVLTDHDVLGRVGHLEKLRQAGAKAFFVYPHAGRPNVVNDILPAWAHITAHFVPSEGQAEVMRAYGYPKPIHVAGWSICPPRAFQKRERPRRVLYAPIHPRCAYVDQAINLAGFERLHRLAVQDEIDLTVRYINDLEKSGLRHVAHKNIHYVQGSQEPGYRQIDQADVVVAHQTYLYMAVARGVPSVGLGTDVPGHLVPLGKPAQYARHWNDYVDLMAYPLDILQEDDTLGLLERAINVETAVGLWRKRMIGEPFDGEKVRTIVRQYVEEL